MSNSWTKCGTLHLCYGNQAWGRSLLRSTEKYHKLTRVLNSPAVFFSFFRYGVKTEEEPKFVTFNPQQPKEFGVNISFKEIETNFSIKIRNFKLWKMPAYRETGVKLNTFRAEEAQ